MKAGSKQHLEYLRQRAKQKFDKVRGTWADCLRWTLPHRATWILSQTRGERKNQHIVDPTHILGLRSFQAGFLEGNTSASRPWYRVGSKDGQADDKENVKAWLQHFTQRTLINLGSSNFYNAAGFFYNDYGVVNTGAHYFETTDTGFFVHTLIPGSYYVLDDAYNQAEILIREFILPVKAVVDKYAKKDWSNISKRVRKMYEDGDYTRQVDIVHVVMPNPDYDFTTPEDIRNRRWLELTYELGSSNGSFNTGDASDYNYDESIDDGLFLKRHTGKRKPFVVGKSTEQFEYGEKGPTLDALGIIKSLNKKAISKDQALEQIVHPALQGPASLRKSYVAHTPNTFVPIDGKSAGLKQKLEPIFQVSPAISALIQDVGDLHQVVDKLYYADFLLYLTRNPRTRTATETNAILEEQQRIIGPNLQSLNSTYNVPVVEWIMDYTLFEDPYLQTVPQELEGKVLKPDFVSVFAQAQKAADLPSVDRYVSAMMNVAQLDPSVLDKVNLDKYADIIEDRLYLPAGLNNPQSKVEAMRNQARQQQARQQAMEQTAPAMAKAAKDANAAGLLNNENA